MVIEAGDDHIGAVRLQDLNGRIVHQRKVNANGRINISDLHLPAGVYLLEADQAGKMVRAKVARY